MHLVESPALADGTGEALGQALRQVVLQIAPDVVLAAHTPQGRDIAPRLAATLDAALAADCIQLSVEGDTVSARRPVYAGKATAEVEFTDDSLKVITVRPRSAKASEPDTARSAEVAQATVELPEQKTALKEIIAGGGERPDVTEAAIIVTGGRSLGSAENFSIIENFADSIGAAVGSSRAAVDAGYRPYRDQVGQQCVGVTDDVEGFSLIRTEHLAGSSVRVVGSTQGKVRDPQPNPVTSRQIHHTTMHQSVRCKRRH